MRARRGHEQHLVLVTGAAGAIGSATVRTFLRAGFVVAGLDRSQDVRSVAMEGYTGYVVDLADEKALRDCVREAREHGSLHHVVGVAGGALPEEPRTQSDPTVLSPEAFRASLEANLITQYFALHAVLPWLLESPGVDRSITFTSSVNALTGSGMPAYSAAKAGLIGLMNALVTPLGCKGIRVNVVAPGSVRTPRTERIWGDASVHFERLTKSTAIGRLTTPDEVANAFLAFATMLTSVTGQVLTVDGGQMVKRSWSNAGCSDPESVTPPAAAKSESGGS